MKINRMQMRNMIPEDRLPGKIIRMKKLSIQYLVILEVKNEYRTCNLFRSSNGIVVGKQTYHKSKSDAIDKYIERENAYIISEASLNQFNGW